MCILFNNIRHESQSFLNIYYHRLIYSFSIKILQIFEHFIINLKGMKINDCKDKNSNYSLQETDAFAFPSDCNNAKQTDIGYYLCLT